MPTILSSHFAHFVAQFEQLADNRSLYLSQEGERFSLVTEKKRKTLNAKKILDLTQQTFENLKDFYWLEEEEKAAIQQPMQKLVRSLRAFQDRLYQTAPWYWKILRFFGFKRAIEKNIHQISIDILQSMAKMEIITPLFVKETIKEFCQQPRLFLTNFYHFILGGHLTKVNELEGNENSRTLNQMLHLLKAYKKTLSVNSSEALLYEQLINQFNFACQFSAARILKLKKNLFFERVQQFLSDPSRGNVLILPGGTKDHFVLYEIEREAGRPTFSLRVINSNPSTQIWHFKQIIDDKQGINWEMDSKEKISYLVNIIKKDVLSPEKIQSLTYTGLTSEQISLDFITKISCKEDEDMESVVHRLEKSLCKSDESNRCFSGRPYRRQIKGVCTQKPLSVWLHNQLGELSYQKFKVFATERLINRFQCRFNQLGTEDEKNISHLTFSTLSSLGLELENEEEEAVKREFEVFVQRAENLEKESTDKTDSEAEVLLYDIKIFAKRLWREKKGRTLSAPEAIAELLAQAQLVLDKRRRKLQALESRQQA
ncbi:hypothetical protein [Candidatus Protochlamydia phocaeensis]|uniref:hypothetical protein n=1 Tax=Candidatus Protochlamydia phocaeensis TaxID=1414722 RepID=UPI000837D964|nr:hypothetical protein [Candidatus Protochlamydia phocaeensis]